MNFKTIALAAVAAVGISGAASAATLSISGGTAGTIPGGVATNEALAPLGFANPLSGIYGGQIEVSAPATLRFRFHGKEAAFNNTFTAYGNTFSNNSVAGNLAFSASGFSSFDAVVGSSGLLSFVFGTNNGAGPSVANGSNSNNMATVNFFAALAGGKIWLFLDDLGGGNDDNHDDMVVSIEVVPLPASALLLLGGLGGIAMVKRRRKAA